MMNAIKGTLENGHVVLDGPTNWPEGCRVIVAPERTNEIGWGLTEEDQAEDPEAIRKWLAEFDSIPPLEMTSEEEAEWQTARQAVKDYTLAKMKQRTEE